jgi:hypothetical protein
LSTHIANESILSEAKDLVTHGGLVPTRPGAATKQQTTKNTKATKTTTKKNLAKPQSTQRKRKNKYSPPKAPKSPNTSSIFD